MPVVAPSPGGPLLQKFDFCLTTPHQVDFQRFRKFSCIYSFIFNMSDVQHPSTFRDLVNSHDGYTKQGQNDKSSGIKLIGILVLLLLMGRE